MTRWILALPLVAVLAAAGCGDGGKPANNSGPTVSATELEIPKQLPELTPPPPGLEQEAVVAKQPAGWSRKPRGKGYLIAWSRDQGGDYPRIELVVEESDEEAYTKDNISDKRKELGEKRKGKILTTTVGDRPALYYRRLGRNSAGIDITIEHISTVYAGHEVTVKLYALRGAEDDSRPHLIAVAQSVTFPREEESRAIESPAVETPMEQPPAEEPGGEEPAAEPASTGDAPATTEEE